MAAANAGVISPWAYSAIPTGHIVQGPSSRTTVVGPDGSAISSVAPGGTIIADHDATIVSQAAPAAVISPSARHVVASSPIVTAHSALVAPAITSYAAHVPAISTYAAHVPAITGYSAHVPAITGYSTHVGHIPAVTTYGAHAVAVPAVGRIAAEDTVVSGPSGTITQSRAVDAVPQVSVW